MTARRPARKTRTQERPTAETMAETMAARRLTGKRRSEQLRIIQAYGCAACVGQFDPQGDGTWIKCPLQAYLLSPADLQAVQACPLPTLYRDVADGSRSDVTTALVEELRPQPAPEPFRDLDGMDTLQATNWMRDCRDAGWQSVRELTLDSEERARLVAGWPPEWTLTTPDQRLKRWQTHIYLLGSPFAGIPMSLLSSLARKSVPQPQQAMNDPGFAAALLQILQWPLEILEAELVLAGLAR